MQAFSLPELVVALTLVGILTTLGMSRYNAHVAKTRQAEAKVNLSHIASLQGIYRAQHLKYNTLGKVGAGAGNCDESNLNNYLGFRPQGCDKLRYTYKTNSASQSAFEAEASGSGKEIYPGCDASDKSDEWTIDQDLTLNNNNNIVKFCSE